MKKGDKRNIRIYGMLLPCTVKGVIGPKAIIQYEYHGPGKQGTFYAFCKSNIEGDIEKWERNPYGTAQLPAKWCTAMAEGD